MSSNLSTDPARRTARRRPGGEQLRWWLELPGEWRESVRAPLDFEVFREPELAAERAFGYDADGSPCFYSHRFALQESRSDDGESFYLAVHYAERLQAWRLRDGRWLTLRQVCSDGELESARRFYTFSEDMPR